MLPRLESYELILLKHPFYKMNDISSTMTSDVCNLFYQITIIF